MPGTTVQSIHRKNNSHSDSQTHTHTHTFCISFCLSNKRTNGSLFSLDELCSLAIGVVRLGLDVLLHGVVLGGVGVALLPILHHVVGLALQRPACVLQLVLLKERSISQS